jgi:hypothetical protein
MRALLSVAILVAAPAVVSAAVVYSIRSNEVMLCLLPIQSTD